MKEELSPELLAILDGDVDGVLDAPKKQAKLTAETRLERAFMEIIEFVQAQGREPDPETMNISERKLGARLIGIRMDEKKRAALLHLDSEGLLNDQREPSSFEEVLEDLLREDAPIADDLDVTVDLYDLSSLPKASRKAAESVEVRKKASDFEKFEGLFRQKHQELATGAVVPTNFKGEAAITEGKFFILKGALAFIAEVHEPTPDAPTDSKGNPKGRLRVIFENGTESGMYRQSFAARLYEEGGQILARTASIDISEIDGEDIQSGYIYVLRSLSTDPEIQSLSNLHKIGFTTTSVEKRIRGAEKSPTYLCAPVEIVASYRVYNVRPSAVEAYLHRAFAPLRLDITVSTPEFDGSAKHVNEWFIAPLPEIEATLTELFDTLSSSTGQ